MRKKVILVMALMLTTCLMYAKRQQGGADCHGHYHVIDIPDYISDENVDSYVVDALEKFCNEDNNEN